MVSEASQRVIPTWDSGGAMRDIPSQYGLKESSWLTETHCKI